MDLNKVMLIGNVGADPEYHDMSGDKQLARFSLATSRKWKKNGEMHEDTQWHNVVVFNQYLLDVVKNFVVKGTRLYLEGELKTRSYEKDGAKQFITEIIVPQVRGEIMVIARGKGWDDSASNPADRPSQQHSSTSSASSGLEDYDDDIPF
jgi:single-strand DNA-binding protein